MPRRPAAPRRHRRCCGCGLLGRFARGPQLLGGLGGGHRTGGADPERIGSRRGRLSHRRRLGSADDQGVDRGGRSHRLRLVDHEAVLGTTAHGRLGGASPPHVVGGEGELVLRNLDREVVAVAGGHVSRHRPLSRWVSPSHRTFAPHRVWKRSCREPVPSGRDGTGAGENPGTIAGPSIGIQRSLPSVSIATATKGIDPRYLEALGPLRPLIDDDSLTEIMVNGHEMVYVERKGKILLTDVRFDSEEHLLRVIDTIVSSVGRRIDQRSPLCDARLLDGSRVNAAIAPVALDGPILTIRKFSKDPYQVSDLIGFGTLTQEAAAFIQACVLARANIVVSGGTGTGKTTLLNVCSSFIPVDERIVTIEDAAELQLHQEHVCRMESRPSDVNNEGRITIRDLVANSLRMRPDRIVVGECRGGEALDMLQAMNTGHDGSLTTVHANNPRETLSRLETLVLMAGMDLPLKAIRQQIASAIDLVIQLSRVKDGSRKVTAISEIIGMEGDTITMQEIFKFESKGADPSTGQIIGEFNPTGIRPKIIDRLFDMGVPLPPRLAQLFPDRRQLMAQQALLQQQQRQG
ncbi:MAG: CpaF family protein [Candidatus Dormibacteraeota bacterium]|uniref:CpaF family protein n=2 Tax=Candidatus Aeolococcus gillhamiae TaxID=3127015 RepID=A0A934N4Q5_9BACT|nr:CpaF family protein [Candidatus Dormibacteraeota bacterium]